MVGVRRLHVYAVVGDYGESAGRRVPVVPHILLGNAVLMID